MGWMGKTKADSPKDFCPVVFPVRNLIFRAPFNSDIIPSVLSSAKPMPAVHPMGIGKQKMNYTL
jgi:hypothetical protein